MESVVLLLQILERFACLCRGERVSKCSCLGAVCFCLGSSDSPDVVLFQNNVITSKISKPTREGEREGAGEGDPKQTAGKIDLQSCLFQLISILSKRPSKHSLLSFSSWCETWTVLSSIGTRVKWNIVKCYLFPLNTHTHLQYVDVSTKSLPILHTCRHSWYLHGENAPKRS